MGWGGMALSAVALSLAAKLLLFQLEQQQWKFDTLSGGLFFIGKQQAV